MLLPSYSVYCCLFVFHSSHSNTLLAVGVVGGVVLWYIDVSHRNIRYITGKIIIIKTNTF